MAEETWYTIGQLAEGSQGDEATIKARFPDIREDAVVEDFNIGDYPWLEAIMNSNGDVDTWLSLVGIPVEELESAEQEG